MPSGPRIARNRASATWVAAGAIALALLCCAGTTLVWNVYDTRGETEASARTVLLSPGASELEQRQAIVILDRAIRANLAALRAASLPATLEPHRANAIAAGH